MRLTEILQNITEAFVAHVIGKPAANTIIVPTAVKRKNYFAVVLFLQLSGSGSRSKKSTKACRRPESG